MNWFKRKPKVQKRRGYHDFTVVFRRHSYGVLVSTTERPIRGIFEVQEQAADLVRVRWIGCSGSDYVQTHELRGLCGEWLNDSQVTWIDPDDCGVSERIIGALK